jgi:hypothetical protein
MTLISKYKQNLTNAEFVEMRYFYMEPNKHDLNGNLNYRMKILVLSI